MDRHEEDIDTYTYTVDQMIERSGGTAPDGPQKDAVTKLQSSLTDRQSDLDAQYNSAYQRYLQQYTALQNAVAAGTCIVTPLKAQRRP